MRMTLVLLLLLCPAVAQDDLEAMAKNVGDYRVKFRLIRAGLPALEHLMPQAASSDARLAFESRSTIRWIVQHTKQRKKVAQKFDEANRIAKKFAQDRVADVQSAEIKYTTAWEHAAAEEVDKIIADARDLASQDKFSTALDRLDELPEHPEA